MSHDSILSFNTRAATKLVNCILERLLAYSTSLKPITNGKAKACTTVHVQELLSNNARYGKQFQNEVNEENAYTD